MTDHNLAFQQSKLIGQQVETCFRMRPYLRNVGVLCTIFFAIVGIVTTAVAISATSDVMKIDLGNLCTSERDQVITFLRASVDDSRQIGWTRFEEQFSVTPVKRQKSLRAQLLLILIFGAHVIAFGVIWIYRVEVQYLIFSGLNGLMTGYLLRRYRRQRSEQPPITAQI